MTALPDGPATDMPSHLDMRRGACPALSEPMMTGDGLLARIALTDTISPAEMADICRLARRHGNGMIDISARGNLQIRGLTQTSAILLDADVRALNLPLRDGLAVEVPPLAGLDDTEIADPRPLAEAIREGARDIIGLAPKLSVIVDGHGRLRLSELLADIRLVAVRAEDAVRWEIRLGGTERSAHVFNVLRETQAVEATLDLLRQLSERGPEARGRDLANELSREGSTPISPVADANVLRHGNREDDDNAASPFGLLSLGQGLHSVAIGPAFGQATAESLIALCEEAWRLKIGAAKPAFDHSLLFLGSLEACQALAGFAATNGFITSGADARSHIAACSGSPACASANIATHTIATRAATDCDDLLDGSVKLHVSGCPKGCAHPQTSALALCGTAAGFSFIHQGKAADRPFATAAFADTNTALRRLADLVRSERHAGENSASCLARLGSERLAAAVMSGRS